MSNTAAFSRRQVTRPRRSFSEDELLRQFLDQAPRDLSPAARVVRARLVAAGLLVAGLAFQWWFLGLIA